MAQIERTIEISADRAAVWAAVADLENVAQWNPNISSVTCDEETAGVGARRTCHLSKGGHIDEVVSQWDEGHGLAFAIGSHGGIRSADMAMALRSLGDSTRVTAVADYHLAFGPLGPVIDRVKVKRQMGRMLDSALVGLKEHVEAQANLGRR